MSIFAVADLHLSLNTPDKEMDVFGAHWNGHWEKIKASWLAQVQEDDIVLIPGDISWGINYDEARPDLKAVCDMPGHKILMRGNHDFWHASVTKTEAELSNHTYFLQNNAIALNGYVFVGTRGWKQDGKLTADDQKILLREQQRLSLSITAAKRKEGTLIGMMHYPPFLQGKRESVFTKIFEEAGVKTVVFGHIHGDATVFAEYRPCRINDISYELISCDSLEFTVKKILD